MRVILFDLDGTLIDSTHAILEGFEVTFKKFGLNPPANEEVKKLIGLPLDIMFSRLGVRENIDKFVQTYKNHYQKIALQKTKLLPFAKEAIKEASEFAKLGIVTTKTGVYSRDLLQHFGVWDYFEVLIGREDVINPKPHPEPILKALVKMGALNEKTYMIGDTCLDMVSAKSAGVTGVGVLWEYEGENIRKCADLVKKDALEAVRHIKLYL